MLAAPHPRSPYDLRGSGAPRHWRVEAAWPESQVALVAEDDMPRDNWLRDNAWAVFAVDGVAEGDLLIELGLDADA